MINMAKLLELDRLARREAKEYTKKRFIFPSVTHTLGKHFAGIVGSRGAGKTILLKQIAIENKDSFYLSVDTVKHDLFEIVKKLHENFKIKLFLLDEIHFCPDFQEALKKVYDFLQVKIVFTSSVSLALYDSAYDLSRRVILKTLYPFSFREYLFFKHDVILPEITLQEILEKKWDKKIFSYAEYFDDYLRGGILPFSLDEPNVFPLLKNVVSTVINKDIPLVGKIAVEEIDLLEKTLKFIGKSAIDGINYSCLSKNLGITKYKAIQYVEFFEKAFILQRVFPKGTNVSKEPKVLMALPYRLLYANYEDAVGYLREDFFVEMLKALGFSFSYLKSTRGEKTPDYLVELDDHKIIIEIGGKTKGREQFKGINMKKALIFSHSLDFSGIKRPLFLCGMLKV